ncbi:MAG: response regulator transcription factor [Cyanobacteria bacterium J06639_14]
MGRKLALWRGKHDDCAPSNLISTMFFISPQIMLNQTFPPNTTTPISVLLVDDNPEFRRGLSALLNFYSSTGNRLFKVIGQAASVDQALALAKEQKPMLILLDMELGQTNGVQFLELYSQLKHSGKVLALSGHSEDKWVFTAMKAGARGYLVKQNLATELHQAIITVLQDHIYLTSETTAGFFRLFHFYNGKSLTTSSKVPLTPREKDVLQCLAEGKSNAVIAKNLDIVEGTVKLYMRDIFDKLEVENRTQAALKALKLGIVSV